MRTGAAHGEAIELEPVRAEHAERLRELRESPAVAEWWDPAPDGWPLDVEANLEKLVVLVDGEVAGFIQFWGEPDPDSRHADVDIFLGGEHQDRGIGTAAMRLAVEHLVSDREHHRITLGCSPENARAIHVYEKVGFRAVGIMRRSQRDRRTGEWVDELLMELVREP